MQGAVDYTSAGYADVMDVHWMVSSNSRLIVVLVQCVHVVQIELWS